MKMTSRIPQILKYVGFGAVLVTALAISWQSMATMALNDFGLPQWLAYAVSTSYDGAAIFTAAIATEYSKTEDSGFMARLTTVGFVGLSAWLNLQHAQMMGLPLAGQVFYAAPAIVAGILFELMLKFENRQELRARGRVAQSLPVYGKVTWVRFFGATWKNVSSVLKHRMNEQTRKEIGQTIQTDTTVDKPDVPDVVSEPTKTKKTRAKTADIPEWMPSDPTMSINKLSKVCYDNGVKSIDEVLKLANRVKNVEVSRASVQKGLNRAKNEAASTGGYL